jgi:hypothetical protein
MDAGHASGLERVETERGFPIAKTRLAGIGKPGSGQKPVTPKQLITNYTNMKTTLIRSLAIASISLAAVLPGSAKDKVPALITKAEVNAAQQAWCDALVAIGKTHAEGGDAKALATKVLTEAYDYDHGTVFFKPTLTHGAQTFRPTKAGALAYFVGGDSNFADDKGFALKPWVKARYDNLGDGDEGIMIHGDIAITMGNVWVTAKDGTEVMVDKTFVFKKCDDGKLRLIVHKSSLPFSPEKK